MQMTTALLSDRYADDGLPTLSLNDTQRRAREEVLGKMRSGRYTMEAHPCLSCGGAEFVVVAAKDRYGLPLSAAVCRACGLVQTNPRMSTEAYAEFYDTEYRRLYVGAEGPTGRFFEGQVAQGRRIADFLARQGRADWSGKRVLEVGCGAGGILAHFRSLGARVRGCDLGSEYLQYGTNRHGLDLVHGPIDVIDESEQFDLILYSHVFEHLLDPITELDRIASRLAPEGVLYLEVPGIHNIRRQYRCDFLRLLQHAHIAHFTLASLNRILAAGGFSMLAGSEYVRAIYRLAGSQVAAPDSDFPGVIESLRRYERLRPINRYLPDNLVRVFRMNVRKWISPVGSRGSDSGSGE